MRTLGMKMVGGVSCIGYIVTPSMQAMIAAAREQNAKLGISAAINHQELQLLRGMSPPTLMLWIDAQGLVREMSINLQMSIQGATDSADMVVDFSHFGTPVQITAPAPADTISFTSFLQKLSQSSRS